MIRCVAIDDEPKALDVIRNHVSRVDFLALEQTFVDPFQAVAYLNDHPVELIFLDINMPDIDGIALTKHFPKEAMIIFTTAHSEYAVQSYELEAIDYLLKPFDFSRFLLAVTRFRDKFQQGSPVPASEFFFVNTGFQRRRLFYRDITHLSGEGNYVNYFTSDEKVLVRSSIKETLRQLPNDVFVQIHRSFIVALPWIDKIEDNHVYIEKHRIPIGATYREPFLQLIDSLKK